MCHLCEERFAVADAVVTEFVAAQEEYRGMVPDRTMGQRTSDLANVLLMDVPLPSNTQPKSVVAVQDLALHLATAIERLAELKRAS